jgi:sugar lactone lactonase YvrE
MPTTRVATQRRIRALRALRTAIALLIVTSMSACDRGGGSAGRERSDGLRLVAEHGSVVRIDPSTGRILAVVPVHEDPLLMEVASGYVWTLNLGDGSRTRIDPATNRSVTVDTEEAVGITSDGEDVWLAVDGSRLQQVDGATGRERRSFELADRPLFELRDAGFLAVADGDLWITIPDLSRAEAPQELWRIDHHSESVLTKMQIGPNPTSPLADGRWIWMIQTTPTSGWLTRIDTRTNRTVDVSVGSLPWGLATGDGSLWVGDVGEENIRRIDRRTGETIATIPLDQDPRGIGLADGLVWVSTETGVVSIDAATNEIVGTIDLMTAVSDEGPTAIVYADGSIWVSIE